MFQIRWMWRNIGKRYHILFVIGLALSVTTSLMLLINPSLSKILIDQVFTQGNTAPLVPLLSAMLAVQLVRLTLRYVMIAFLENASQNALVNLRRHLFQSLQYQEIAYFDRRRTGDLMTRLSGDLDWCRHFLAYLSYNFVDSVVTFVSTLVLFFTVDWRMTLCMLVMAPLLAFTTRVYSKKVHPLFAAMRERLADMNTSAQENIAGHRVVRAFAREEYEKEEFGKRNSAYKDAQLAINKKWLSYFPLFEMMASGMTVIAIFAGALFMILGDSLTFGQLTIFTTMSWALSNPMRNLGPLLNDLQRFATSAAKVMEVYYANPLVVDRDAAVDHPNPKGLVQFDNVSFSYGSKKALDGVSFTVEPGQTLAIMGPTGSGKTTLIQLLARFYDVKKGSVMLDGDDVRKWHLQDLRRAVSPATQDVFLFSDTVEGNICFGNQQLTVDEVKEFAAFADADEFAKNLPEAYDTVIGERGVGLSGGQRQRLALARAMAMRPAVLVLDDTTSALDMETEQYIQEQIKALPYPCTKIIIAQRISSVKDADRILILENGRITEQGTHEELLRNRGYYWETHCLQNDIAPEGAAAQIENSSFAGNEIDRHCERKTHQIQEKSTSAKQSRP